LLGPGWVGGVGVVNVIGGNYTAYLQPGAAQNTSISQTGTIPSDAESLTFKLWQPGFAKPILVSFAGDTLSPVLLGAGTSPSGQAYTLYGVDVAPFANQTGALEFTAQANGFNTALLDDISFSTTVVPEPSALILTGIAGATFACYWRRVFRKSCHLGSVRS
jgi:hypothetical protein